MHDIAGSSPSVHGLGIQNKLALANVAFKFCVKSVGCMAMENSRLWRKRSA